MINPETYIRNLIKEARAEERKLYAAKMDKRLRGLAKRLEGLHVALLTLLAAEPAAKVEAAPKAPRKPRAKKEIDKAILDKVLEVLGPGSSLNGEVATAKNIERASGISRLTTKHALDALITVGLVTADGKGRGRTYKREAEESGAATE